jgi:hypothetical protein
MNYKCLKAKFSGNFGPKKSEVGEQFRILHNQEICNLYTSRSINRIVKCVKTFGPPASELGGGLTTPHHETSDQIKENEVDRACGMHGQGEKRVQSFGGKVRREKTT